MEFDELDELEQQMHIKTNDISDMREVGDLLDEIERENTVIRYSQFSELQKKKKQIRNCEVKRKKRLSPPQKNRHLIWGHGSVVATNGGEGQNVTQEVKEIKSYNEEK